MKKKKESKQPNNLAKLKEIGVWEFVLDSVRVEGGKQNESSREFCAREPFKAESWGNHRSYPICFLALRDHCPSLHDAQCFIHLI